MQLLNKPSSSTAASVFLVAARGRGAGAHGLRLGQASSTRARLPGQGRAPEPGLPLIRGHSPDAAGFPVLGGD